MSLAMGLPVRAAEPEISVGGLPGADGDDGRSAASESFRFGMPPESELIAADREAEPEAVAAGDVRGSDDSSPTVDDGDIPG